MMNAAVALGVPPARIMEHCDSVSLCFSKVGKLQEGGGPHRRRLSCVLGLLGRQLLTLGPLTPSPNKATVSAPPHPSCPLPSPENRDAHPGMPGDKGGVAKPAVVRLGDDEAGGFRVPPTAFPRPLIQSRNLRFSPSKSLRERPEKSRPKGQGWWSGKLPPPGRDKPRTQKGPVVDTHPCAQVVRARQSRGRERRQRPRFGRRGWGQARGRPPRQSAGDRQQLPPPPLGVRAASRRLPARVCQPVPPAAATGRALGADWH